MEAEAASIRPAASTALLRLKKTIMLLLLGWANCPSDLVEIWPWETSDGREAAVLTRDQRVDVRKGPWTASYLRKAFPICGKRRMWMRSERAHEGLGCSRKSL